jgi:acyl-CoA synthetase (AMP-forming)/AMP-acid ligase II
MNDPMMECVDLSSIRFAFAPLPYDLCQKVQASFGAPVLNPYGMTETAALVMVAAIGDAQDIRTRTVGRPLKGMQVKVIAEDTGLPVANGTPGMLLMRGPSIMWRYHEQPEATAEALDGEGWLRTGDIVRMDDLGNVTFIGRRGDSYRVGGEIVDPVEIEAALQSHPDVLRAAALGVPDDRLGQVGNAWVQLRPGSGISEADLQAHAAGLLATFKVPRAVRLIEEFPTTASGKVQKFRLRDSV